MPPCHARPRRSLAPPGSRAGTAESSALFPPAIGFASGGLYLLQVNRVYDSLAVYPDNKWSRMLFDIPDHCGQRPNEYACILRAGSLFCHQHKRPDLCPNQRLALDWSPQNHPILCQHDPVMLPYSRKPFFIAGLRGKVITVDMHDKTVSTQCFGNYAIAQCAVKKPFGWIRQLGAQARTGSHLRCRAYRSYNRRLVRRLTRLLSSALPA